MDASIADFVAARRPDSSGGSLTDSGNLTPPGDLNFDRLKENMNFTGEPGDLVQLMNLQIEVNREMLFFETLSNVIKTRHDVAMNSVRNVKG